MQVTDIFSKQSLDDPLGHWSKGIIVIYIGWWEVLFSDNMLVC